MGREKHSEEKIIYALKQVEAETPVKEVSRQMSVLVPTYYQWKKKFQGLGVSEAWRSKQLQDENRRLK
jgi:putative transposase